MYFLQLAGCNVVGRLAWYIYVVLCPCNSWRAVYGGFEMVWGCGLCLLLFSSFFSIFFIALCCSCLRSSFCFPLVPCGLSLSYTLSKKETNDIMNLTLNLSRYLVQLCIFWGRLYSFITAKTLFVPTSCNGIFFFLSFVLKLF